jgi:NAD(P)-dependent dehydrogenase (short-subunit alcohol dehydrogenase family)
MQKIAVVTGAYQGIGKGIADGLKAEGYTVIYSDVHPEMEGEIYCKCDISKEADRKALAAFALEKYGRIDLLVNNAGVACKVRLDVLETTEESFDRVVGINTKGTFFMCQTFANAMIECQAKGLEDYTPRIVNIASNSSYTSSTSRGEYCISKAGVSMITKLFADRLAGEGITVNEVCPGIIATGMTEAVKEKYDRLIAGGLVPLGRWGTPDDIAKAVVALCDGTLGYMTGASLILDGGMHIRKL